MAEAQIVEPIGSAGTLRIRIITPHSGLDAFSDAIQSLRTGFGQARRLAWRFFLRDTMAEHRQSVLGYFWLVFPALANTLTWVFLNQQQVIQIKTGAVPYPVFVLAGTILWSAFNGSLMAMLGIVGAARGLLAKVNFPREALVYAAMLKSAVDATLASLLLLPALLIFKVGLHATLLLFPLALLGALLLGSGLGLAALPLAALYGDVGRAIQILLRFGFFLTPIVFALPIHGVARALMIANPVTPIIVTGRAWLTGSGDALLSGFVGVTLASMVILSTALIFYKVALPYIIERVSG